MKLLALFLLSCGSVQDHTVKSCDGGNLTVAVETLDEIKLGCRQWREYTYFSGFELKTIWICDKYWDMP